MSCTRYHRICLIGSALVSTARMDVNIRHDRQAALLAKRPKLAEITAVEVNDAGVETVGIQIVIKHEINDPSTLALPAAEQESSAFAGLIPSPFTKFLAKPQPQKPGTGQLMPRRQEAAYNLEN